MNDKPTCGACNKIMTPENSTTAPEFFLCDDCAPKHGFQPRTVIPPRKNPLREECFKALHCLHISVDKHIARDVNQKVKAYIEQLSATLGDVRQVASGERQVTNDDTEALAWIVKRIARTNYEM